MHILRVKEKNHRAGAGMPGVQKKKKPNTKFLVLPIFHNLHEVLVFSIS